MKRKRYGCLIAVFAVSLLFIGLFVFFVVGGFVDYRLETYEAWHLEQTEWMQRKEGRINPMPSLDDLRDAQEVIFQKYTGNFWGEEAYILIVKYDQNLYENAKQILNETLVFETEVIDQGKMGPKLEPEFTMERFHVRLLKTGDLPYAAEVPKDMYFAGTSDDSCEILYIYHDDVDLDGISGSFGVDIPRLIRWKSVEWRRAIPFFRHIWLPVIG